MCKNEMISEIFTLAGALSQRPMASSGILSKRAVSLAKHEVSKSSANAPTFLVNGFVIDVRLGIILSIDPRIVVSTCASVILCTDTNSYER